MPGTGGTSVSSIESPVASTQVPLYPFAGTASTLHPASAPNVARNRTLVPTNSTFVAETRPLVPLAPTGTISNDAMVGPDGMRYSTRLVPSRVFNDPDHVVGTDAWA